MSVWYNKKLDVIGVYKQGWIEYIVGIMVFVSYPDEKFWVLIGEFE